MRIGWDEKAQRLAAKHELYDYEDPMSSDIEDMLTCRNGVKAVGIIDETGRQIWWTIKKVRRGNNLIQDEIVAEVVLRERMERSLEADTHQKHL